MEDVLSRVWEDPIGRGSGSVKALIVASCLAIAPYLLWQEPVNRLM